MGGDEEGADTGPDLSGDISAGTVPGGGDDITGDTVEEPGILEGQD